MNHETFKKQWTRKHGTILKQLNRVLEKNGFKATIGSVSIIGSQNGDRDDACASDWRVL
jgi:hypothetical protein